ncbi:MAG TPA: response regulator, partial [Spirochaetota bacterium]|nr:response regulator [Spirochaetota bacterium]
MDGIKKRILLVEDEFLVAILEQKDLEKKGYLVQHVGSGEEAVKAILDAAIHVDLILMDIDLGPGIDGTQAAERILEHKDIPVVFLSSHTEPEVVEKTEKITSYGYVVKNTGVTVLDASIKMALKLFEARMERGRAE